VYSLIMAYIKSRNMQPRNLNTRVILKSYCHSCYAIQLMHYSHFKTQSLQHLKPIKCLKSVCKYKTPTCFCLFSRPSSGRPPLCFVSLLLLPLICVRWVCIIMQYVAACVCQMTELNERKSAGGIVMAQNTAEDPLKMVVKKDRNM